MTQLELELAALRQRRQSSGIVAWFRSLRPFDRRAIREPDDRDAYWVNVQRRLAESDAGFLMRGAPFEPITRTRQAPVNRRQLHLCGPS